MKKTEIKQLVKQLTLEEKATLLSGRDAWSTKPIERLGIPSINMSDGPHGLRRCIGLGWVESVPATCFPPAALLACSFDGELAKKQGAAIGEEAQAQDIQIVLGPANNIKRTPLGGRNFEYFSEDPFLSGQMAKGLIDGIQWKKVGTSLKHFAANSQETDRFVIDEKISERALREIYLASFEFPVIAGKPTSLMCAYNRVNGEYCSQNYLLLTDILRKEWGFKGFVMSDWGACDNRPQGVYAGLELEMPGPSAGNDAEIVNAASGGTVSLPSNDKSFKNKLTMRQIDHAVTNLLEAVYYLHDRKNPRECDYEKHHKIAAEAARESMVLLKNDGILPLKRGLQVAVLGEMAVNPRYQGSGSSRVNAINVEKPLEVLGDRCKTAYSQGYSLENDEDFSKIPAAAEAARNADCAVIICGLPDAYESEGYDRTHMSLPKSHLKLIDEVSKVQPLTIVVLCNGSPVEMPFVGRVSAILEAYLGGEAAATAISDILFGIANPCGKLAETFPQLLEHNPSYTTFPGENKEINYSEGIFVGYRWYEKHKIPPLFPFGYGLSYTKYKYSDIKLSSCEIHENEQLTVAVHVKNDGPMDGKEIVQLYVGEQNPRVTRPVKELRGFKKVPIKVGEVVEVSFTLDSRAFAYWDDVNHRWRVDTGMFNIYVGTSSVEYNTAEVKVIAEEILPKITIYTEFGVLRRHPKGKALAEKLASLSGISLDSADLSQIDWMLLRQFTTMAGANFSISELLKVIDEANK